MKRVAMLTGVSSVAVLVNDAEESAKWYVTKLGFEASAQGHWVAVRRRARGQ